jgi:hypothetical protein
MKKAKSEIEFNDLLEKLFDKLKAKSLEFIEDIDFDKLEKFMEKQITKCKDRRNARKAK